MYWLLGSPLHRILYTQHAQIFNLARVYSAARYLLAKRAKFYGSDAIDGRRFDKNQYHDRRRRTPADFCRFRPEIVHAVAVHESRLFCFFFFYENRPS